MTEEMTEEMIEEMIEKKLVPEKNRRKRKNLGLNSFKKS